MLNLYTTNIETLSVHRVGNQSKGEPLFLSESPYALNDEIIGLLKEYFFKCLTCSFSKVFLTTGAETKLGTVA